MFGFIKKIIRRKPEPGAIIEEKWNADFSEPDSHHQQDPVTIHAGSRFDIKSESSYDAYLQKGSLALALKKPRCIAWIDAPEYRYQDQVIDVRIALDAGGGYAAAGFLFRMMDEGTYYSVLISSKGYFRLDAVRNNMPLPLAGWTELPSPTNNEPENALTVIAYGAHLVLLINGFWAAEISEPSIPAGTLGFVLASYRGQASGGYTAQAFLKSLSVNTRLEDVEAAWHQWENSPAITPQARFALAETFAAMGEDTAALVQLEKMQGSPAYQRTQRELLLAGRLAFQLEHYAEADEYADACLALDQESPEGREAVTEKAKILYAKKEFEALRDYAAEAVSRRNGDPLLYTLLGHAYWDLADYERAAAAYDRSFELDKENGLPAKNAANVYEVLGRRADALDRYLRSGRLFLGAGNYQDLGTLAPKLLSLGRDNWEAHALVGKWAFGIEDFDLANTEFTNAETLRKSLDPAPEPDPAIIFLRALILIRNDKRGEALPLLETAAALAPDYGLFHFRLAETRFLLNSNADDPETLAHLDAALSLLSDDDSNTDDNAGWVYNFAAEIALKRSDLKAAEKYLEMAAASLGDLPAVRVNESLYHYLRGSLEDALKILEANKAEDEDGILANCAGNLLVRAGQFERADEYYVKALSIVPGNMEFLTNRASCLIELGYYGEADTVLAQAHSRGPTPAVLELITYVAVKKGEFARAESACGAALEIDGNHHPSLLNLGWIYSSTGRWDEVRETLTRLETMDLDEEAAARRAELQQKLEDSMTRLIPCTSCSRNWRVPRDPPAVPSLRLRAMPPDELPAGSCPECGRTYCIGCAKQHLDRDGRFTCPACGRTLKLINEGLKKIVADWAAGAIAPE
ncbi:hypothetical protein AGMMS50255_1990 [Spirochaetia bacterium]|nr:hypothetical protein AGMMS50255_1990 [Spirochaetia bacterium]